MPTEKETILVVDDEVVVQRVAELMLTRYGYSVITAQGGTAAIELVRNLCLQEEGPPIDLAVIDINMPDMDGFVLTEKLRVLVSDLPVIYLASYSDRARLSPAEMSGRSILTKPFSSQVLTREIRALLDKDENGKCMAGSSPS